MKRSTFESATVQIRNRYRTVARTEFNIRKAIENILINLVFIVTRLKRENEEQPAKPSPRLPNAGLTTFNQLCISAPSGRRILYHQRQRQFV
jgi:hypothetical protein